MPRVLATFVFAYAGMAASQWGHAMWRLYTPQSGLYCGNVITDPYLFLANVITPIAAFCTFMLVRRCVATRRWPCIVVTAILTFAVTTACLAYECHLLDRDFGFGLRQNVRWLPHL